MFTITMLVTITLSVTMAMTESVIFLNATGDDGDLNSKSIDFIFKDCGLQRRIFSATQNYIQWLSCITLAQKYHIVSLSIDTMSAFGTLLSQSVKRRTLNYYILLAIIGAVLLIVSTSLSSIFTQNSNISRLLLTETWASILVLVLIMFLTVSFVYSYAIIRKALVSNNLNMSMNKKMLTLNISLICVIFISQISGWFLYGRSRYAFTVATSIETYARVLIKIVFLALLESFG